MKIYVDLFDLRKYNTYTVFSMMPQIQTGSNPVRTTINVHTRIAFKTFFILFLHYFGFVRRHQV